MFLKAAKPVPGDLCVGSKVFQAAEMHRLCSARRPADGGGWQVRERGATSETAGCTPGWVGSVCLIKPVSRM